MPKVSQNKPVPVTAKTEAVFSLIEGGMPVDTAYAVVHPDKKLGNDNKKKLMQNYRKYSLTRPNLVKAAQKAIQDTVSMTPITIGDQVIVPTVSNRLTAAQMIVDRAEPIINKNLNINANLDISPVDLSMYVDK